MGTAIVVAVIIGLMILAGRHYFKQLKNGGCGCGCSGCAMSDKCHGGNKDNKDSEE